MAELAGLTKSISQIYIHFHTPFTQMPAKAIDEKDTDYSIKNKIRAYLYIVFIQVSYLDAFGKKYLNVLIK